MSDPQSFVRIDREGPLAVLTIDRQDKLNALNSVVLQQLSHALASLDADQPRVAILTGAGEKAFVAGADIAEMLDMSIPRARQFSQLGHDVFAALERAPFPIIAAVNGFALGGGCELALACDFIIASDNARFSQPEVSLGVIPGFGGTQRLVRRIGIGRARELLYTGDMLGADEAARIGLVNRVVPRADLLTTARELASRIASKGPLAVASAKRATLHGADLSLSEANAFEVGEFSSLFGSRDRAEGMRAFAEKRKPTFTGE